jgi:hypothetical protein
MVEGILDSIIVSAPDVWVAIPFPDVTSLIEKIEQRLRNALGSLSTILAHPDQCRPVPGPKNGKKSKPGHQELPLGGNKAVEVG